VAFPLARVVSWAADLFPLNSFLHYFFTFFLVPIAFLGFFCFPIIGVAELCSVGGEAARLKNQAKKLSEPRQVFYVLTDKALKICIETDLPPDLKGRPNWNIEMLQIPLQQIMTASFYKAYPSSARVNHQVQLTFKTTSASGSDKVSKLWLEGFSSSERVAFKTHLKDSKVKCEEMDW
jgi:hypothetical protein